MISNYLTNQQLKVEKVQDVVVSVSLCPSHRLGVAKNLCFASPLLDRLYVKL